MIKTFVVIGLGAVIVFAPLAAMAQSAHAGGGGSHSRHMRYSRNAHKERVRAGAEHVRTMRHAPALTRADQRRRAAIGDGPTERAVLTVRGRGYFTGQGFTPQIS
jgi:hypothetical protein